MSIEQGFNIQKKTENSFFRMILTAHTGDILGQWKCDWKCPYLELIGEPELIGNQVKFDFKVHSTVCSTQHCHLHIIAYTSHHLFFFDKSVPVSSAMKTGQD